MLIRLGFDHSPPPKVSAEVSKLGILHRVLRMRLKASKRQESPARLLEQLRRIQHQTAQTGDGQLLRGLTELGAAQKELFTAIGLPVPTPDSVAPSNPEVAAPVNL